MFFSWLANWDAEPSKWAVVAQVPGGSLNNLKLVEETTCFKEALG
jgi:hypothetical protein